MLQRFGVDGLDLAADDGLGEAFAHAAEAVGGELAAARGVGGEGEHGLGQRGLVAGGASRPLTPSSTTSSMPPAAAAMTGTPAAMASITVRPKGSGAVEACTMTSRAA